MHKPRRQSCFPPRKTDSAGYVLGGESGLFVAVNYATLAAVAESLLESELFGHENGAFTGAVAQKKGEFEWAAGGSLFLVLSGDLLERAFANAGGDYKKAAAALGTWTERKYLAADSTD